MANYTDWRRGTLARLNAPQTPENLQFLEDWNRREGGHFNNSATYNWLNTTRGDQFPAINSHNVRAYPDFQTGVDSTAQTLMLPHYTHILGLLRAGQGNQVWDQAPDELAKWGTLVPKQMPGQLPVVDAQAAGLEGLLANTLKNYNDGSASMLKQTQEQLMAAQGQQQQLFGQMEQAANAPAPQNDPKAEFYTRLMGNISQVLAPGLHGQQAAEETIQKPLDDVQQRRAKNFQLLAMKHQEAARQAEKLGDQEKALKHYDAVEKNLKQAELLGGILKNREDNASRERIAAAKELRKGGSGSSRNGGKGGSRGDKLRAHADSLELSLQKGDIKSGREKEVTRLIARYRAEADSYDAVDNPDVKAPTGVVAQYTNTLRAHIKALGRPVSQDELLAELKDPETRRNLEAKGMTVDEAKAAIQSLGLPEQQVSPQRARQQQSRGMFSAHENMAFSSKLSPVPVQMQQQLQHEQALQNAQQAPQVPGSMQPPPFGQWLRTQGVFPLGDPESMQGSDIQYWRKKYIDFVRAGFPYSPQAWSQ